MTRFRPLIVEAKLARPRPGAVVPRPRLMDLLRNALPEHRLTLVTAGAGYGKTTLLAALAAEAPMPALWYSLGPEDGDLTSFLAHIAALLRRQERHYGRSLRALVAEGAVDSRGVAAAAGALLNDLHRIREPLVFVLDDFHRVAAGPDIGRLLGDVVENNASPVRFVLASRVEPALPLGRLRARRQLFEIGPADLAFTTDEFRRLLETVHRRPTTDEELAFVSRFTEGWVTPVQLALQAGRDPVRIDLPRALERAMGSGAAVHDYLADEIVNEETEERRRWMLRSSLFEEMEPALLGEVLGDADAGERLAELHRRRLVQVFEGPRTTVYRYHVLLRELLRRRFERETPPEEREALHRRAAGAYARRKDPLRAARQLALLPDPAELAAFLRRHALALLDGGHYQALLRIFDALPADTFAADPWLRLRRADARHFLGDWTGAELDYESALAAFRTAGDLSGEAWCTLGIARLCNLRGQAEQAATQGGAILARLDAEADVDEELIVRLLKVVSGADFYCGRHAEALARLDRLEALAPGHPDRQAVVWNNRAVVYASRGNYAAAAEAFEKGLRRPGARRAPRAPLHLSNLALLLIETGDWDRARRLIDEALRLARRQDNRGQILSALIGQAHLDQRVGNVEACLERLREVEELNREMRVPLIEADAAALRGRVLRDAGQFAAAREQFARAVAAGGDASRDPNRLLHCIEAAVVDLRAGRLPEAAAALDELAPTARELGALFPRMRLEFHAGEIALLRGEPDAAAAPLARALELSRQNGFDAFLLGEYRRDAEPFLVLLRRGEAVDDVLRIAARDRAGEDGRLLALLEDAALPESSARGLVALLGETGGPDTHRELARRAAANRAEVAPTLRRALQSIERRHPDLRAVPGAAAGRGFALTTLGRLRIVSPRGEVPLETWTSRRALAIFLYLAHRGERGAGRDRLIELFWPGGQRRRAAGNFHPTLSYIRRALRDHVDGAIITVEGGLYRIDPDLPVALDVQKFEAHLAEARRRTGRNERRKALEAALALYQGDFLEEHPEAWTEEPRHQLAARHETLLGDLGALYEEAGEIDRATSLYRTLLERNPFREEAHVRLMGCYTLAGDRRAVREHWQRLVRLLREELGVEPLPETTRSYEALVAGS
jgi:LuxR family maltose regulon positive regulatory protein